MISIINQIGSACCSVIEDVDASKIHRLRASSDLDGVVACGKFSRAKDDWEVVHTGRATDGALAHSGIFVCNVSDF